MPSHDGALQQHEPRDESGTGAKNGSDERTREAAAERGNDRRRARGAESSLEEYRGKALRADS